ncbi:MAG: hypothetical protein AAF548_04135 [Actinomycetota bacterium]
MRRFVLTLSLMCAFALVATSCFGGDSDPAADPAPVPAENSAASIADDIDSNDGVDDCGQGQAWPDDPDFREAVCRPYMAMLDLISGDASGIPAWQQRIQDAILSYDDDRDAAIAALNEVTAEIEDAAG